MGGEAIQGLCAANRFGFVWASGFETGILQTQRSDGNFLESPSVRCLKPVTHRQTKTAHRPSMRSARGLRDRTWPRMKRLQRLGHVPSRESQLTCGVAPALDRQYLTKSGDGAKGVGIQFYCTLLLSKE